MELKHYISPQNRLYYDGLRSAIAELRARGDQVLRCSKIKRSGSIS